MTASPATDTSPIDPEPDALALSALHLRELGETYRLIGEVLGVSKGTAHRLVQRGHEICLARADLVMRVPSRKRGPTRQWAEELLGRLRLDFERVYAIALDFADPTELGRMQEGFNKGADLLASLISQDSGPRRGLRMALIQVTRSFHGVLREAGRREAFAEEVDSEHVADVFRQDALSLGAIISPRAKPQLPRWEAGEADGREIQGSRKRARKLSRKEREGRDLQIELAHAQGATAGEIAELYGLTERQVRRVLAKRRREAPPLDRRNAEEISHAVLRACRRVVEIGDTADAGSSPAEFGPSFASMIDAVALLKDVGAIPAGGLNGAAWRLWDRTETVAQINRRVREMLSSAECNLELIDRVTDTVIAEAVPELARLEAAIRKRTLFSREHVRLLA
jgi:transposase